MSPDEDTRQGESPERSAGRAAAQAGDDDEPMGGDPACWLHLFEDEEDEGTK
jgi:hypothetical protein